MPQKRRGPILCLLLGKQKRQRAEGADIGVLRLDDRMTLAKGVPNHERASTVKVIDQPTLTSNGRGCISGADGGMLRPSEERPA